MNGYGYVVSKDPFTYTFIVTVVVGLDKVNTKINGTPGFSDACANGNVITFASAKIILFILSGQLVRINLY